MKGRQCEMAYCSKCGTQLDDNAKFCPRCGAPVAATANEPSFAQTYTNQFAAGEDLFGQYEASDIQSNKVLAVLAYLGLLVLVPIFAAKDSKFARFHANQGLVLFLAEIIYGFVVSILTTVLFLISWVIGVLVSFVLNLLWLVFLAFVIMGIVYAATGKAKELPIIGKIRILK